MKSASMRLRCGPTQRRGAPGCSARCWGRACSTVSMCCASCPSSRSGCCSPRGSRSCTGMSGKSSSSSWSPPAGSRGLAGCAQALRAHWPHVLLRLLGWLVAVSLLWVVLGPVYANGLALLGRTLRPVLEGEPDAQYTVEGGRLLVHRTLWFPKQPRTRWVPKQSRRVQFSTLLWDPMENYGVPLLAALILATPAWRGRRGPALAWGLAWLTLTQIAFVLLMIVTTQQGTVRLPDQVLLLGGASRTQHLCQVLLD